MPQDARGAPRPQSVGQTGRVETEDLRVAVYRSLAGSGRGPSTSELSTMLGMSDQAVEEGLRELARARHVVLDDSGRIVMAHPFAAIPLGFSVMGTSTLWWGGCAWDSFPLPNLVPDRAPVLLATRCPACGRPHSWSMGTDEPPAGDQVAHFLVPVSRIWDDVVHTCRHQSLFCSTACVDAWLDRTGHPRGYVMDLGTLWRLASRWYEGRLDRGYVRREPAEAADYFRSVGLHGPFWGL
jgi:hypothetical protein